MRERIGLGLIPTYESDKPRALPLLSHNWDDATLDVSGSNRALVLGSQGGYG
jgi:hypothetical protein